VERTEPHRKFPVEITAIGDVDGKEITWTRNLNSAKGRGGLASAKPLTLVAESYQERMRSGDRELKLPIISYYGTGRLWAQHKEKKGDTFEKNNRSNGYIDSLDGAANDKLMMKTGNSGIYSGKNCIGKGVCIDYGIF